MPLNIDWQQILIHLFNFVILAGGLYFLLYNPVKSFMDKRTEDIKKLEEEAKTKLSEAQRLEDEYQARLKAADDEIGLIKAEAVKTAEKLSAEKLLEAEKQRERIISDAKNDAERRRKKAIEESREEIVELAAKMAEKILREGAKNG